VTMFDDPNRECVGLPPAGVQAAPKTKKATPKSDEPVEESDKS
jgi:hypothetical protein